MMTSRQRATRPVRAADPSFSAEQAVTGSWVTVLLLWTAGISAAMQFAKMSIGFDAFQSELSTGSSVVSELLAACGIFGLIFGVAGASITARMGLRKMLLGSLVLASMLSLIQAVSPPISIFYITRLLEGATNLFIVVAAPALIVRYAPARRISSALALWGTFYGVAFGVAGSTGPTLIAAGGTPVMLATHAALTIVVALLLWTRPISDPDPDHAGSTDTSDDPASVRLLRLVRRMLADNFRAIRHRSTLLPGLIFLFHSSIYLGLLIFVPLMAPTPQVQQLLHVGMPLISILTTLAMGPLANGVLSSSAVLSVGFPSLVVLSLALTQADIDPIYALTGLSLMAISGLMQGSIFILPPLLARKHGDDALAFGLIAQLGSLGSIIGPVAFEIVTRSPASGTLGIGTSSNVAGFAMLLTVFAGGGLLVTWRGLRPIRSLSKGVDYEH
ncbi:MFS transporter [Puniceibacterium sediminis]|uniref:Major Facilitator Superfamily protein n=1 Tax=Puniceibacterium sediminis TaxID=1608407 RepID=A0A238ZU12_9RHOB|nr:MFS transporter [Puniceibacterium sediminis]SNR86622.1 Major Facilitator Superfamily protein [Puniceibacterium sediminis]